jgi:hypothetical protein
MSLLQIKTKTCSKCLTEKLIERFSKRLDGADGYRKWCKDCAKDNTVAQRKANPIKFKEIDRVSNAKNAKRRQNTDKKWRKDNPERLKNRTLKRLYGITLETYNLLLEKQNHSCAICNKPQNQLTLPLCVDHCHSTGKVRGLLCKRCNSGLGFFNDNVDLCKSAVSYLDDNETE